MEAWPPKGTRAAAFTLSVSQPCPIPAKPTRPNDCVPPSKRTMSSQAQREAWICLPVWVFPAAPLHAHSPLSTVIHTKGIFTQIWYSSAFSAVYYMKVPGSAVQCSAVHCSAVQWSAVQCSAVQCPAYWCSGFPVWRGRATRQSPTKGGKCILHFTVLPCTSLHITALHCTPLHTTAHHCTSLHSTPLHITALHTTGLFNTALRNTELWQTALANSIPLRVTTTPNHEALKS